MDCCKGWCGWRSRPFLYLVLLGGVLYGLWHVYQQQLFLQRALTEERRRIARELHDGVGFQLVHVLAQCSEQAPSVPQMRLALEQALIELHAAVDLMQPDSYCLVERLAGLRYRIQPALNHRVIELVWWIADGMDTQWLPAQSTVHVLKGARQYLAPHPRDARGGAAGAAAPAGRLVAGGA